MRSRRPWFPLAVAVVAAWVVAVSSAHGAAAAAEGAVAAVVNVTVIDPDAGTATAGRTVVWRGERIEAVGAAGELPPLQGARVINGSGKFLIPGLWDMHAHVLWPGLDTFFPLLVAHEVTGVRDMGTHFPPPVCPCNTPARRWRCGSSEPRRASCA